jgi:uncharacterized protein YcaQ
MDSPTLSIAADHARRFLVTRHLLAPSRSLPAEQESVMTVVQRLGLLQFDPLEVPGARNHDLVLHSRIGGYRREWCDALLYGADRRLIELYNKSLNILPIDELPHYRVTWDRNAPQLDDGILKEQAEVATAILAKLKTDGPLSTAAFAEHGHAVDWWWAPTRASRAVMEALFVAGRIGIARRDGNRRYYDLIERLVPTRLLSVRESQEDARRHRMLSRFRATGLTTPVGTQAEVMYSVGSQTERVQWTERLVADGELLPVQVEGLKRPRYIIADEEPILDATADPMGMPPPSVSFLAALDPLVWDRRQLRELWSFDYLWEVYVPEAKRKWGYYVLPIVFGDRFVGRIEPRIDRKAKTLNVRGIWFEPTFAPMEAHGFIDALRDAIEAYRCFIGAATVEWPRTRIGRELGLALGRQ